MRIKNTGSYKAHKSVVIYYKTKTRIIKMASFNFYQIENQSLIPDTVSDVSNVRFGKKEC